MRDKLFVIICVVALILIYRLDSATYHGDATQRTEFATVINDGYSLMTSDGNVFEVTERYNVGSKVRVTLSDRGTEKVEDDVVIRVQLTK